jgi:hypothetical protein
VLVHVLRLVEGFAATEKPLDGSFLNISLEETVHTTKYDSYQYDICQKKFKSQQNLKETFKNP